MEKVGETTFPVQLHLCILALNQKMFGCLPSDQIIFKDWKALSREEIT